jgi:hypothetical protein
MLNALKRKDLWPCVLILLSGFFVFRDILVGGHLLFGVDFFQIHLSTKQFLFSEIATHHTIPLWNPYIFSGMPFWAHFESTIFYPLGILFWVMAPEKAYGYTMFLHLVLSGMAMYLLARSFHFTLFGAFVASTVYLLNGFVMATLYDGQMFRIQSYLWIPVILFFLNRALRLKRSPFLHISLAGLFWGIQILAGAPQDAFYTFLAAMIFWLACLVFSHERRKDIPFGLGSVFLFFAIGLGVAAVQVVPAAEFVSVSVRAALDRYELMTLGSYPPEGLITALLPHFFGNYTQGSFWVSGTPWSIPLYNLYVGVFSMVALLFLFFRRPEDKAIIVFSASLALFALVLALGKHTPLYKIVVLIPGFGSLRAPSKILVLWAFAFSLLAGKGMDGLVHESKAVLLRRGAYLVSLLIVLALLDCLFRLDPSFVLKIFSPFVLDEAIPSKLTEARDIMASEFHRLTLLTGAVAFLIFLHIRNKLRMGLFAVLLCGILLLDLGYVNRGAVRHSDELYEWAAGAKEKLGAALGHDDSVFRVGSFPSGFGANFEMYLGYQTVGGYSPLCIHRYYEYINHYRFYGQPAPQGWSVFFYDLYGNRILMDLLNVKYEISHAEKSYALRQGYLPRAFWVPDCKILPREAILDHLRSPHFDPTRTVLLEKDDSPPDPSATPAPSSQKTHAQVNMIAYRPDRIVLETTSSESGFLFLSEVFYPGWKAYVDGKRQKILRGNYLFRTLELPSGTHRVTVVFEPASIKIGVAVTLLTLLVVFCMLWGYFRRKISRPVL